VEPQSSSPRVRESFLTTRWSIVTRAASNSRDANDPSAPREVREAASREAREALESLCSSYWYPLYAYARRRGLDHHAAQDGVQGFFARLIEKQDLAAVDRARGRFRSFLLAALKNYLSNEWDRERAHKRGGAFTRLSYDEADAQRRYHSELAVNDAPEKLFERQWAREVIARALTALESEWKHAGRETLFARLKPSLVGAAGREGDERDAANPSQTAIARELGLTENAVRIALHRLRKRFGELVRLEIAETVADPADVERELGELFDALGS